MNPALKRREPYIYAVPQGLSALHWPGVEMLDSDSCRVLYSTSAAYANIRPFGWAICTKIGVPGSKYSLRT